MFGLEPLTPAYGRDYKSLKAVQEDFDGNKDFMTQSGQVTNKSDLVQMHPGKGQFRVRYQRMTKVNFVKVKGGK